jgi:hypothetical protein
MISRARNPFAKIGTLIDIKIKRVRRRGLRYMTTAKKTAGNDRGDQKTQARARFRDFEGTLWDFDHVAVCKDWDI